MGRNASCEFEEPDRMSTAKFLIEYNDFTYRRYIAGGKTFLHSKMLYRNNALIRDLILEHGANSGLIESDLFKLLHHIDVWMMRWEEAAAAADFSNDDSFDFENEVDFPERIASKIDF